MICKACAKLYFSVGKLRMQFALLKFKLVIPMLDISRHCWWLCWIRCCLCWGKFKRGII